MELQKPACSQLLTTVVNSGTGQTVCTTTQFVFMLGENQPFKSNALNERLDLNFALQAAGLGVWEMDPVTGLINWDERCQDLFGLPNAAVVPYEQAIQHIHADDRERVTNAVQKAMDPQSGGFYDVTHRTIGADDKLVRWVNFKGRSYFTPTGEVYRFAGVAQDVTSLQVNHQTLEASEAKFRTLIEQAPVATCFYIGPTLKIDLANQLMIDFYGKGDSILGKPIREVLTGENEQGALFIMDQVYSTGKPFDAIAAPAELVIHGVAGTYYFDFSLKPVFNAAGQVYAIIQMAIDVTQQVVAQRALVASEAQYRALAIDLEEQVQARTRQLERTVQDLRRSNQNLEQFAYIASHDLQEPLRKIQSFGDLLSNQYGPVLGKEIDYLTRMQAAAGRMSVLIRDLLSFSKINTSQVMTQLVPLDELIRNTLTDLELVVEETGAEIEVRPLPTIAGDASQLGQLFGNLLSNALKFRRKDNVPRITIECQTIGASELPPSVLITRHTDLYHRIDVADNGIGFDVKYLDRMFQVFQRLHSRGDYSGTGIGLAICEKVVTNHGGGITASSQVGQGAVFSIFLPIL